MKPGDRVFIADRKHQYAGCEGTLVAFGQGLSRTDWRVRLDENRECRECYANTDQLMAADRTDIRKPAMGSRGR
ncbi:MAG TPA: hypothetical protein VEL77_15320 [Rugosimonospora sp.]|nr:hypothetical protein [Rugosimonospora sp.]